MAIKIMQLSNPNFLSQLGAEHVCTAFMFHSMPASEELKQSKEGYIPGVDISAAEEAYAYEKQAYAAQKAIIDEQPWLLGAEDPSCAPGAFKWGGKCWYPA